MCWVCLYFFPKRFSWGNIYPKYGHHQSMGWHLGLNTKRKRREAAKPQHCPPSFLVRSQTKLLLVPWLPYHDGPCPSKLWSQINSFSLVGGSTASWSPLPLLIVSEPPGKGQVSRHPPPLPPVHPPQPLSPHPRLHTHNFQVIFTGFQMEPRHRKLSHCLKVTPWVKFLSTTITKAECSI